MQGPIGLWRQPSAGHFPPGRARARVGGRRLTAVLLAGVALLACAGAAHAQPEQTDMEAEAAGSGRSVGYGDAESAGRPAGRSTGRRASPTFVSAATSTDGTEIVITFSVVALSHDRTLPPSIFRPPEIGRYPP